MSRIAQSCRTTLPVLLLLLTAGHTAHAAKYGKVERATWGATGVPSYVDMYMSVPDTLPEKPPIIVNIHSCSNTADGQYNYAGFAALRTAIDSVGYIMIIPQATNRNCWDVGTAKSLTHDGGGDTEAIARMVRYVLETYHADPTRVYAMGGSSGGMMTQALLAVYPDLFKAGHARAGVPAGCWSASYDESQQWSDPCAHGMITHTGQEWGDQVRAMFPSYTGSRPRLGINQGTMDTTIYPINFDEAIKEWTNVLGLAEAPTSSDKNFAGTQANYDRQFWSDSCGYTVFEAWAALGKDHSMGYEAQHILEWFGLDQKRDQDPWDAQCGGQETGTGGAGNGAGGADSGAGGTGAGTGGVGAGVGGTGGLGAGVGGTGSGLGGTGSGVGGAGSGIGGAGSGVGGSGVGTGSGGLAAGTGGAGLGTGGTDDGSGADGVPGSSGGCSLVNPTVTSGAFSWALLALGYGLLRRRRNAA
jgi:acetylxylan esterase